MKRDKKTLCLILENIDNLSLLAEGIEVFETRHPLFYFLMQAEDCGLTRYKKRNFDNWNYWWYEVADGVKPNKRIFTADLKEFEITKKGKLFLKFSKIDYFKYSNQDDIHNFTMQFVDKEIEEKELNYILNYTDSKIMELF